MSRDTVLYSHTVIVIMSRKLFYRIKRTLMFVKFVLFMAPVVTALTDPGADDPGLDCILNILFRIC